MNWNHRMVRTSEGLQIFDVYYDEFGRPISTSATPSTVYGETVEELQEKLGLLARAISLPILEESAIGSNGVRE